MCCFMEKMLAHMLADYELKLEKEVLEPLNKLSEVRMGRLVLNRNYCNTSDCSTFFFFF